MKIAVIPARGGSKRIPGKNINEFAGKPIIAWSIEKALESGLFEHVIVSTDVKEIADISLQHGAEVPFFRPNSLADDFTGTNAVIVHAIQWALENNWPVSSVCCIYATAPFIQINDLKDGNEKLQSDNWDFVFPVCEFSAPVFRSFKIGDEGEIEMFYPEHYTSRSQDLPLAYHDAGQFYWGKKDAWLEERTFFSKKSYGLKIPRWRVHDIDVPDDWHRAEIIFKAIYKLE